VKPVAIWSTATAIVGACVLAVLSGTGATVAATSSTRAAPKLPKALNARLVTGTRFGKAVRVTYCFRSMPTNPWTRPWRLHLTLDNVRDGQLPLSIPWKVPKRCGTIFHPVGGIKPPYELRYFVASRLDTRSPEAKISLR
jgi:hypothetical protein